MERDKILEVGEVLFGASSIQYEFPNTKKTPDRYRGTIEQVLVCTCRESRQKLLRVGKGQTMDKELSKYLLRSLGTLPLVGL